MSTVFDNDILIHHIAAPGLPGDGFTAPEAVALRNDLDTLLSRPVITEIDDIPNVDTSGVTDGQALVYRSSDGDWVAGERGQSVDGFENIIIGSEVVEGMRAIAVGIGLKGRASANPEWHGVYIVEPIFGTSENTISNGAHTHTNPIPVFQRFSASGYLSGGSRQVVSRSVALDAGITYVVVARFRPQVRGADEGAAYYRLRVDIAGNPRVSDGGASSGFWCVQGVPKKEEWVHAVAITGTGSSVTVSGTVQYHSGAGLNVDAGELEIDLRANR